MIRYALACANDHEFEGWFASSTAYDEQQAAGQLSCPVCETRTVHKQIMAPAVSGTKRTVRGEASKATRAMMMEAMGRVRQHVEDNFDDVGDAFAKEARAIHEGKSEERGIYGNATPAEVKSLVEDGVPVAPLPAAPPKKTSLN